MIPWQHLDTAPVPGSASELQLYRRDQQFSIRVDRAELMNSQAHASEDALAALGCERIAGRARPRLLIGGLGMGFSVRAALDALPADAEVEVAELVPAVVKWNREQLGHLAGHPLRDARVTVRELDVAELLRSERQGYDLILLDVDNGPEGLTRQANDWIYSRAGLLAARAALCPHGVVAYWASAPSPNFVRRLHQAGFNVEERALRARRGGKGAHHIVWFAVASEPRGAQPASQGQRR